MVDGNVDGDEATGRIFISKSEERRWICQPTVVGHRKRAMGQGCGVAIETSRAAMNKDKN